MQCQRKGLGKAKTRSNIAKRSRDVIPPLDLVLVWLYLECCVQFWDPRTRQTEHTGESPTEGCQDAEGPGAALLRGEAGTAGAAH